MSADVGEALDENTHRVGFPAAVPAPTARSWRSEPNAGEVLALAALACLVGVLVVSSVDPFWERVRAFGDNGSYVAIARAIRRWEFSTLNPYHFWGLSYGVAAVALVTSLSEWWSLVIVSVTAALGAMYLMQRLWGGWVACYFIILSLEWQQRTVLGGAEPLFVLLILLSLTFARRERWALTALFAALATVVRPTGMLLLLAIAVVLFVRKDYRRLIASAVIGLAVGAIYVLPLLIYFGDPLANFRFYQNQDWGSTSPIGLPFVSIVNGAISFELPWTARARAGFWILFYILAVVAMFRRQSFREYARRYPVEVSFAGAYILFAFSYNSPIWAWLEFARYSLPVLPIALHSLEAYLPRDRRLVWSLIPISAALAAISAMNARRVMAIIRTRL